MPTASPLKQPAARSKRKALGAYYTPPDLADALVRWAVDTGTERVLDPSYGDGRFLRSAIDRYRALGVGRPHHRVFGAELDDSAIDRAAALQAESERQRQERGAKDAARTQNRALSCAPTARASWPCWLRRRQILQRWRPAAPHLARLRPRAARRRELARPVAALQERPRLAEPAGSP